MLDGYCNKDIRDEQCMPYWEYFAQVKQRDTDWDRCQEIIREIFEDIERKCLRESPGCSYKYCFSDTRYQSLKSKYIGRRNERDIISNLSSWRRWNEYK